MATSAQLAAEISAGTFDETFRKLYAKDTATVEKQRARYLDALEKFEGFFGANREVRLYSAPGRTEIGGNHTDHNNGIVMAASVNLDIIAVVGKTDNNIVRVKSYGFDKMDTVDLATLEPVAAEKEHSAALVRGVAAGFAQNGGKIGGFDAYTTSDVLRGSGLSSSAAFEVCMGAIFRGEYNNNDFEKFSQVKIAQIGQYAENVFFGKPSGLLDQTACAVGSAITIDLKDPKAPVVEKVAFDLESEGYALCISDTKGSHADLTPDYAAVRGEMEAVAAFFGKSVLREVDEAEMYANIPALRAKVGDRAVVRAIHFFNDSRRAAQLCEAIRNKNFPLFLELILQGGHSSFEYNQNAYSISHPAEQGLPLGLAVSQKVLQGCGAWRLQGGGFAGTVQAFVPLNKLEEYRTAIDSVFGAGSCYVLSVRNFGAVPVTETM